jgi:hypothetical protein
MEFSLRLAVRSVITNKLETRKGAVWRVEKAPRLGEVTQVYWPFLMTTRW